MKIHDFAKLGLMLAMSLFLSSAVANADSSDSDSGSGSVGCTGWDCFPDNPPPSSSPVPEPTGILAFAAGALTIGWVLRRRSG